MEGKTVEESSITLVQLMTTLDVNNSGNVHGGVIMKLVDTAGGLVAMRHAHSNVVTASIDRLDFHHPVYVGNLVTIRASLNLTGRTSMEVGARVETENPLTSEKRKVASAYLTFVALDKNGKPTEIPPVIPESDEEKRRNQEAISRREVRLREKQAK